MKHHGSYQQDDRDKRSLGQGKFYQFMMRTKQPGGHVSNQLYLTMDDLADQVIARPCSWASWHGERYHFSLANALSYALF